MGNEVLRAGLLAEAAARHLPAWSGLLTPVSEWPILKGDAIAHSFESHATLHLPGDRDVRYIAPDRIAADNRIRVVLFKTTLTTGWDCPRAEVMLSFRTARDYTNIAQLIGRMVRTPLAERIETDESLNSVVLYLPHYSKKEVAEVVKALGDETGGDVEIEVEPVDCVKNATVPKECFDLLLTLPSAARVKKPWRSETDRLLALARLLRGHNLVPTASSKVRARLVGAIKTEAAVRAAEIRSLVDDVMELDVSETVWDNRRGRFVDDIDTEPVAVSTRVQDIDTQFATSVRAMPDATAKWYWNALCDEMDDPYEAKAHVAAIAKTTEMAAAFKRAVEDTAATQIEAWRAQYANQVQMLGKQARLDFEGAWSPKAGTLTVDIEDRDVYQVASETIIGTGEHATTTPVPTYTHHLYAAPARHRVVPAGQFPFKAGSAWEVDVLEKELDYPTLVGWYRNPARSKHGLAVPYPDGEGWMLTYPDFLFFHSVDGENVVDVVDPHGHQGADTGPKWAVLARWAHSNKDKVRRVVAVIKADGELKGLDLTQDGIAERLDTCSGKSDIETLFETSGGSY